MMKIIPKSKLNEFLSFLADKYKVWIPIIEESHFRFKPYTSSNFSLYEFSLYINTNIPAKDLLFPQKEILFTYSSNKNALHIVETPPIKPQIIFGVRNCDARSFLILDKFFTSKNIDDPYYIRRRTNTILIGLACLHPYSTCFCSSVGGGPLSKEGFDGFLIEFDNAYYYEAISEVGTIIFETMTQYSSASPDQIQSLSNFVKTIPHTTSSTITLNKLDQVLDGCFKNPIWESLNQQCIMCGTCSYLCPTCHCFDVQDEKTSDGGFRYRLWDTCQFPLFTQEASGHNPRKKGGDRTRHRIYHKFNYYPKNYGIFGCIGCGRCIRLCPMNHDIRNTIERLLQLGKVT